MFGDATPHQFEDYVDIMSDPDYVDIVTEQIDWRDETEELAKMVRARRSYICSLCKTIKLYSKTALQESYHVHNALLKPMVVRWPQVCSFGATPIFCMCPKPYSIFQLKKGCLHF